MVIELRVSEFLSKLIPFSKREGLSPSPLSAILGHQKLFDFYGISCDLLKPLSMSGITELQTRDGVLSIDWDKRVIIPPPNYYSSRNNFPC